MQVRRYSYHLGGEQMIKKIGEQFDIRSYGMVSVYECSDCGLQMTFEHKICPRCKEMLRKYHEEEASLGIL